MRRKKILVIVASLPILILSTNMVYAAPPLHFNELPGVFDMFLPPPPPAPLPQWIPAEPVFEFEPEIVERETWEEPDEWLDIDWDAEIWQEPAPPVYIPTPEPAPIPEPEPEPVPEVVYHPRGLTDVAGHWAQQSILFAFDNGLVNVFPDNTVRPNQPITRGEFAFAFDGWIAANYALLQVLGFTYDGDASAVTGVPFDHPFRANIESLAIMGMVGGNAPFMPDEQVQRQEVSRILLNLFARLPNSVFDGAYFHNLDTETILAQYRDQTWIAEWARDAVAVMTDRGFMGGAGGTFRPQDPLTRAETYATFFNIQRNLIP